MEKFVETGEELHHPLRLDDLAVRPAWFAKLFDVIDKCLVTRIGKSLIGRNGLSGIFEQFSEKGFALVTMPIPITNDFTHDITALIDQESRREGPCFVKL